MTNFKPKTRATCVAADDRHRYILLHADKPVWMVINEVGHKTFTLCDSHNSVGQIAQRVSQTYGMPLDLVLSDVKFFISRLVREGFILPPCPQQSSPKPVEGALQPFEENRQPVEEPLTVRKVELNITENCNLRCRHCAVTSGTKKEDRLTLDQIFKIVDEAQVLKVESLTISGGEPLLREDSFSILAYAARRITTTLATNGTLIDDKAASVLSDLDLKIQISLDGPNEDIHDFMRGENAFLKTMRALDLMGRLDVGKKVTFCAVVSKNNLGHIPALLRLASEKGVSEIRFIPLQNMGMARSRWHELAPSMQDYVEFYSYMYQKASAEFPHLRISPGFQGFVLRHPPGQDSWCQIGRILTIDVRGDIYPCSLFMEPAFRLGNIRKTSLQKAIDSPAMKRIREICLLRKSSIPECQRCPWRNFCQGGCPGSVYQAKGTLQAVDDLCQFRKQFYAQAIFTQSDRKSRPLSNTAGERDGRHKGDGEDRGDVGG
ncbi:MAG: PqqD family peptide modification chaperone [bacterium]